MSTTSNNGIVPQGPAEDLTLRSAWESARLATAAMALLHCRRSEDVYSVAGDFIAQLVPDSVVIINEATPEMDGFITRNVSGLDGSSLAKAAGLLGFDIIGMKADIRPALRNQVLSGTLSKLHGGAAELASRRISRPVARAGARLFGLREVYTVGIADQERALGNCLIFTRTLDAALPTYAIESFAHHCFSALSGIMAAGEMAETSERNALLVSSMVEGLGHYEIILDAAGTPCDYRILAMNPALEAMMGTKATDVVGLTRLEVQPDTSPVLIERYGIVAMTAEPARFEACIGDAGRYFDIVAFSPKLGQFACVITDVTERKMADKELAFRNIILSTQLETSMDGILVVDEEARILSYNKRFVEMWSVPDQFVEDGADELVLEHVAGQVADPLSFRQGVRYLYEHREQSSHHYEVALADGRVFERNSAPMRGPDDEYYGRVWYFRDVTAGKEIARLLAVQAERIATTLTSVIDIASNLVEMRDPYTAGHQRRVAELATAIAQDIGLWDSEIEDIRVAALLHDVGKITVPAEILSKPGKLSAPEFDLIRAHAEAGYRIVASAKMDEQIAEMVYEHHERCDGSGYPRGLLGEEVPLGAKVLAVADVVEAMISHRPYRKALGVEAALTEIEQGAGRLFDAEVSSACIALFREGRFEFSSQ